MSRTAVILLWVALAIPLALLGAAATWFVASPAWDSFKAHRWVKARATVQWVEVQWPSDERARVMGSYRYEVGGREYEGDQLIFGTLGAGRLDWWPVDMYDYLRQARDEKSPIMIWVDPDEPSRSVVDRELGTGTLLLMLPLAVVLDTLAFLALKGAFRAWRADDDEVHEIIELRDAVAVKRDIEHLKIMWVLALIWNGITWMTAIHVIQTLVREGRWFAYLVVVPPIVGLWFLWRCVVSTYRNWDEVKLGFSASSSGEH